MTNSPSTASTMAPAPAAPLRIVLHAPSAAALARARSNALNLRKDAPAAEVRIVLNAEAVAAALDAAHPQADPLTWLCPNTLAKTGRAARAPLQVLPVGAVLALVQLQQAGWVYLRA